MQTVTPPGKPSRFNPWPISIVGFFGVAILGCGAFIAFCSRHPADLISPNYYEEEIRYQGQIDRIQHAQQQSAQGAVRFDGATKRITVFLPSGSSGAAPAGRIQLYRPSAVNLDRELKLETDSSGAQSFDAATLLPGLWKVRVSWTVADQGYFIDEKIVIPSPRS